MWERSILKSNAKLALSSRYGTAIAICLVAGILANICNTGFTLRNFLVRIDEMFYSHLTYRYAGLLAVLSILSMVLTYFAVNILSIGKYRYFVHNHFGDSRFETLFSGFKDGYMNCVGATFVTSLFISLWMLLLIVPGIIKAYQYYFVSYLLSDNPRLTGERAREISRMITDNEKWNIFVLELSFFGWYLLCALTLGIGTLFLNPYYEATIAELYIHLRDRAIQSGWLNPEELCLGPAQPPAAPLPGYPTGM